MTKIKTKEYYKYEVIVFFGKFNLKGYLRNKTFFWKCSDNKPVLKRIKRQVNKRYGSKWTVFDVKKVK